MLDFLLCADCSNKVSDLGSHSLTCPPFVSFCATTKSQLCSLCQIPHPVEILRNICSQFKKKKMEKKKNQRQNNGLNMMFLSSKICPYDDISYGEKMVTWKSLNGSLTLAKSC